MNATYREMENDCLQVDHHGLCSPCLTAHAWILSRVFDPMPKGVAEFLIAWFPLHSAGNGNVVVRGAYTMHILVI